MQKKTSSIGLAPALAGSLQDKAQLAKQDNSCRMKAVICTQYGPPEVLQIREVSKPVPKDNQILVRIVASSVNSGDVRVRSLGVKGFLKLVMLLVLGISKPRKPILGNAFSGVVESVGNKVSKFKPDDRVFGMTGFKFGTYAEYIVVDQDSCVTEMPANAAFEEAAAIVFGGHTAVYFLDKARIAEKPNKKILIIGATGSVGTAAVQIAKHHQAYITAVCSSEGQELAVELGAARAILYDKEDFTKQTETYDIVFDAVGKSSRKQCKKLLKQNGIYKSVSSYASDSIEQLELLKELFEKGKFKAVIDRTYQMGEIVEAHRYVGTERKKGNVVLWIGLVLTLMISLQVNAQYARQDSTYKKYYVGSTLFMLGNLAPVNKPDFVQLNFGYRITGRDVISLELITWKYAWPLGINPMFNKLYGKPAEEFPGYVREFGFAVAYQRYLWKGLYLAMHVMPAFQTFVNNDGRKIDKGFQLFNTNRVGYHIKLFKDRLFIEPSIGIAYRPYHTKMPDGFRQKDDRWPKFTGELGMHFGVNF